MTEIIKFTNVHYHYKNHSNEGMAVHALKGVNVTINAGEFIVILGKNGSGKSTFARHINGILIPDEGNINVFGYDSSKQENNWEIRKMVGMVFQNPDNQLVGTIVEEDVAFGPENLGIESKRIRELVDWSLEAVNMIEYRKNAPHRLSGGQKQRIAIAGILAMNPQVIVLDESTSMLDPISRREIMNLLQKLNNLENKTIIHITHHMEEALKADRVIVFDDGVIVMDNTPKEVFKKVEKVKSVGLDVPQINEFIYELNKNKIIGKLVTNTQELKKYIKVQTHIKKSQRKMFRNETNKETPLIKISNLSYTYMKNGPFEKKAIEGINLEICKGEILGIIGPTGSGKSTLIQHFNGIMKPETGNIHVLGYDTSGKKLSELRKNVGLVFQYPEHQLFEETIYKDIAFGLKKLGLSKEEENKRIYDIIEVLELDRDILEKSPFDLSGGQKRRVAIAGVAVMQPAILVLDEPTAGLDPAGREDIHRLILSMHKKFNMTVCIVSHDMEYLAALVDRVIVLDKGKLIMDDTKENIFSQKERLESIGLAVPKIMDLFLELNQINSNISSNIYSIQDALNEFRNAFSREVV